MYSYGTTSDRLGTGCSTSSGCPVKHIMFLMVAPAEAGAENKMLTECLLYLAHRLDKLKEKEANYEIKTNFNC